MPIKVTKHKSFKELLDEMKKEYEANKKGIERIVEILTKEKWEGSGAGSAAYPRMKVLVDPDENLIRSQLLPILAEMINNVRALRSSMAVFRALFSESELSTELDIEAVWDGSHARLVIVRTMV